MRGRANLFKLFKWAESSPGLGLIYSSTSLSSSQASFQPFAFDRPPKLPPDRIMKSSLLMLGWYDLDDRIGWFDLKINQLHEDSLSGLNEVFWKKLFILSGCEVVEEEQDLSGALVFSKKCALQSTFNNHSEQKSEDFQHSTNSSKITVLKYYE